MKVILVTGGAGFVGSNFIRFFLRRNKNFIVANIDKLTHEANLNNLKDIENSPRYHFVKGDICNSDLVDYVLRRFRPSYIINFAEQSSPERCLANPVNTVEANITGITALLNAAHFIWNRHGMEGSRFIHISTGEVYGQSSSEDEYFLEDARLNPTTPYAASKASSDIMALTLAKAYGIPLSIARCCSCYGPYQKPGNLVPDFLLKALSDTPLSIPGNGSNYSEWMHVRDCCTAVTRILFYGKPNEVYNIGSGQRTSDLELAQRVLRIFGKPEDRMEVSKNGPAQWRKYELNSYKARNNLGWNCKFSLEEGLRDTALWYKENREFWNT